MVGVNYRIEYLFSEDDPSRSNIVQYKRLISHKDYLNDIKPKQIEVYELEIKLSLISEKKKKKSQEAREYQDRISELKKYLNETYGESWFTDAGLFYKAIKTGVIRYPTDLKERFEYLRKDIKVKITKKEE
jgi:hypothetical protein